MNLQLSSDILLFATVYLLVALAVAGMSWREF